MMSHELQLVIGFGGTILAGLITGVACMWSVIKINKGERGEKGEKDEL